MKRTIKILDAVTFILMISMTITVSAQVVSRFVFPLTWSEEFAKINLMWLVYIGLMSSFYYDKHVRIDLIDDAKWISDNVKKAIRFIFYHVFGIVLGIYITIYSIEFFSNLQNFGQKTVILQWPMYLIVIPFIAGGILTSLYFIYTTFSELLNFFQSRKLRS